MNLLYKNYILPLITLLIIGQASYVYAVELQGVVVSDTNKPIEAVNVILLELDLVEFTDELGKFQFIIDDDLITDIDYTIKVIAEGFEEKDIKTKIPTDNLIISIASLEKEEASISDSEPISNTEITITEKRIQKAEAGQNVLDEKALTTLPTINDNPISLVVEDTGVNKAPPIPSDQAGRPAFSQPGDRSTGKVYTNDAEFSVYGAQGLWNRYFFGYIQLPTNIHPGNPFTSIVTTDVLSSLTNFKGISDSLYGPGLGGTLILKPFEFLEEKTLLVGISPFDPRLVFKYELNPNISFMTFLRHNLSTYTLYPIVNAIIDIYAIGLSAASQKISAAHYGDLLFTFNIKNMGPEKNHRLNTTLISFYDNFGVDLQAKEENVFDLVVNYLPVYFALGAKWDASFGDSLGNSLNAYWSIYYNKADDFFATNEDGNNRVGKDGNSLVYDFTINEAFTFSLNKNNLFNFGLITNYNHLRVTHKETLVVEVPVIPSADGVNPTLQELARVPENTQIPSPIGSGTCSYKVEGELGIPVLSCDDSKDEFTLVEQIFKLFLYTDYKYQNEKLSVTLTPGVSYVNFKDTNNLYPSFKTNMVFNITDNFTWGVNAGWSPSFPAPASYLDRKIAEYTTDTYTGSLTNYSKIAHGVVISNKLLWNLQDKHSLILEPYFSYYYGMSGIIPSISQSDKRILGARQYKFNTAKTSYSAGAGFTYQFTTIHHIFSMAYNVGFSLYDAEEYGWIPPKDDYRHKFTLAYTYSKLKQFNIGLIASMLIDYPFTPDVIQKDSTGQLVTVTGDFHSARDYLPISSLILKFSGVMVEKKNFIARYAFVPGDLAQQMQILFKGLKDKSKEGNTSADVNNREYKIEYAAGWLANLKITFDVVIKLP